MKNIIDKFKICTDEQRIRMLMLLDKKELCVCQLMGIIESSQSLISRNISLLNKTRFLNERRDGKLRFYSIRKDLGDKEKIFMDFLRSVVISDPIIMKDFKTSKECSEYQKKTGKCDMKTLQEFMKLRKKKRS